MVDHSELLEAIQGISDPPDMDEVAGKTDVSVYAGSSLCAGQLLLGESIEICYSGRLTRDGSVQGLTGDSGRVLVWMGLREWIETFDQK